MHQGIDKCRNSTTKDGKIYCLSTCPIHDDRCCVNCADAYTACILKDHRSKEAGVCGFASLVRAEK